MVRIESKLITFLAVKDGEALYSEQKKKKEKDFDLTVAQIISSV